MLIKKKDVNSYFAARRSRHPLSVKQASAPQATNSSKDKGDGKFVSPAAGAIDAPASSAPAPDSRVPAFTSELGFIDASPPAVKRWTKS
jgi:hypothetical protein